MKKNKKALAFMMAASLCAVQFAPISITGFAAEQTIYTGVCGAEGDNITWTYDADTQTMTFSGTGAMKTYVEDRARVEVPEWICSGITGIYEVKNVVFEEGITDVKTIYRDFFKGRSGDIEGKDCTITIPESVTSMDFSLLPAGVKMRGKYGSWIYYNWDLDCFDAIGVAEKEYIPSSGETEAGFKWNFDYVTRILTIGGTDAIDEEGHYSREKIEKIYNEYAKTIVIEKDFVVPVNEERDAGYWLGNGQVPGSAYANTWMYNPEGFGNSFISKVYCYKNSDFANVYESLKAFHDSDPLQMTTFLNIYDGRVIYIDDPNEILIGDLNLDGKVDLLDAIRLNKYTANIVQLTDAQEIVADCNGDGNVDDADVTTLMEYLMFQVPSLPYQA